MPVHKYSDYLEVNPLFESVVDIDADYRNPNLWQEYIVGKDMENLVEYLCQSSEIFLDAWFLWNW